MLRRDLYNYCIRLGLQSPPSHHRLPVCRGSTTFQLLTAEDALGLHRRESIIPSNPTEKLYELESQILAVKLEASSLELRIDKRQNRVVRPVSEELRLESRRLKLASLMSWHAFLRESLAQANLDPRTPHGAKRCRTQIGIR